MDSLDLFLAVSTAAVVVAALLFPINRDDRGQEKKDPHKDADDSRKNPEREE